MSGHLDVVTIGRIGVDLYPLQDNVGLEDVETFGKYLGGSATNVAVAAARHGRSSAVITRTGPDAFGRYVHKALKEFGVDDSFVSVVPDLLTPITFCEMYPPDHFPLLFYRLPTRAGSADPRRGTGSRRHRRRRHLLVDGDRPVRGAQPLGTFRRLGGPGPQAADHPGPGLPADVLEGPGGGQRQVRKALAHVTVAVGNKEECEIAVGETEPMRAAKALLDAGVEVAIVKQGPRGVLGMTKDVTLEVPPTPVDVINGLGAGDGFGGALCHGLLSGWDLETILRFANAAGAIVATRRECSSAMPTTAEVEALLKEVGND